MIDLFARAEENEGHWPARCDETPYVKNDSLFRYLSEQAEFDEQAFVRDLAAEMQRQRLAVIKEKIRSLGLRQGVVDD